MARKTKLEAQGSVFSCCGRHDHHTEAKEALKSNILTLLKSGMTILDVSKQPDTCSRAEIYNMKYDCSKFMQDVAKAEAEGCEARIDTVESKLNIDNIQSEFETHDKDGNAIIINRTAHVQALKLYADHQKWHISQKTNKFDDDKPIVFELAKKSSPEKQLEQVLELASTGKINLTQAERISSIIYKRMELLELPKLIQKIEEHEKLLKERMK